jgi:uncharacterized protein YjbJ (UPF0337 family)
LSGTLVASRRLTHGRRPTCIAASAQKRTTHRSRGALHELGSHRRQLEAIHRQGKGKLTDDDITQINGNREQLEGKIQARYGFAKDQVRKDVDDWLGRM